MQKVIITAPSLDPTQNVSGVSSVVQFIIDNNKEHEYTHFELGKKDKEKRGIGNVTRILKCYKNWKKTLKGHNCIVHYSFPLSAPSILRDPLFMNYARKKGVPMVVHLHGGVFLTAPKIPYVLRKILQWVFSWDVPFIVLSEGEKDILQNRWGAKHVEVLPNCPEPPQLQKVSADEESLPTQGGLEGLSLGYLGRIEVNKGMDELLEACKILKAEGIPYKLRLAGKEVHEGEYIPLFERELGDNFEYAGLVSGETKRNFLRSLDILTMPTYFEGLPVSLLECMSYGAVPVITPVGSIPTVVKDNENGIFITLKDVNSIVAAIKQLHANPDILKRLSANAQKTIADNFSARKYIEKLNAIYDSLYANR